MVRAAAVFRILWLAWLLGASHTLSAQAPAGFNPDHSTYNLMGRQGNALRTLPDTFKLRNSPTGASDPVKRRVMGAIWSASQQAGVDYGYLLAQAHLESGLNPNAKARTSSAAGLFQFIEGTWLQSLERYELELKKYRLMIGDNNQFDMKAGSIRATRKEKLGWRHDPQFSSLVAAAYASENAQLLHEALGRRATRTELYLAHFLGSAGARRFLKAWERSPYAAAAPLFPKAASANRRIFTDQHGRARSLNAVLENFENKMAKALALFEDDANQSTGRAIPRSETLELAFVTTPISHSEPCYHIEMCYGNDMNTSTITQVRDLIETGSYTKAGIARAAGLHANTLRDANEADWNPTAETLTKLQRFLDANDNTPVLVNAEEIIDEARNGRMYILVDDEDRENEGDLIIPAQMATPAAVNFMATHGRGLICLALDKARVNQLNLDPMSRNNKESMQTAFTVSIEAKEGVTTGISAADRARTISVAIDASKGADDIVTPGHVFPLMARDGGTLVRAGHTEAAVDISRLAGLNPSGVICEIMNEDGTMARLDDLIEFARKHDLKIGTIRDLIAYRMRNDHLVERVDERSFESDYGGQWRMITYRNTVSDNEAYVLQKGHITLDEPTLARVHPISVFDDVLGAPGPRKRTLQRAMGAIGEKGSGIIVILTQRVGSGAKWTPDEEHRNIGIGSQILADLGVQEMTLLSNSRPDLVALEGYGITIAGHQSIPD